MLGAVFHCCRISVPGFHTKYGLNYKTLCYCKVILRRTCSCLKDPSPLSLSISGLLALPDSVPTASFPPSLNVSPSQILITKHCVTPTFEKYAPYTKCLALAESSIVRSSIQKFLLSKKHSQKTPGVVQLFALA